MKACNIIALSYDDYLVFIRTGKGIEWLDYFSARYNLIDRTRVLSYPLSKFCLLMTIAKQYIWAEVLEKMSSKAIIICTTDFAKCQQLWKNIYWANEILAKIVIWVWSSTLDVIMFFTIGF